MSGKHPIASFSVQEDRVIKVGFSRKHPTAIFVFLNYSTTFGQTYKIESNGNK